jgi:hypothetical protein
MRGASVIAVLGAGCLVLLAQLVVWLTPVRNLLIGTPENPPFLETSETPANEGVASLKGTEEAPVPAEDTVAQGPASPEPEAKSDISPPDAEETPVPAEDTLAQGPASPEPEAKSDISPPDAEETPVPAEDTLAQAPATEEHDD